MFTPLLEIYQLADLPIKLVVSEWSLGCRGTMHRATTL